MNRLKRVLDKLVSECQSAFIKGRQITDSVLIANEIVQGMKRGRIEGLILKIDFEKAFDTISWDFLFSCLDKMNFGERWIKWLKSIFDSIRVSVLVNGSPTSEFKPKRGLRQGDPLSPLLFLLVGEVLNCLLSEATKKEVFRGVKINDSISISHLQFADDTILFINKDFGSVQGIKRVLQCFELLSGLKINFDKSSLYGYRTSAEDIAYWASKIGYRIGSLPINYLGMPLGLDPSRKDFWIPLQEKFKKNLAGWKSRQVNQAGKLVMLKATLDSLPNYWFNMFLMPI